MNAKTAKAKLKAATKLLTPMYGISMNQQSKLIASELNALNSCVGAFFELGMVSEFDAVAADLRREMEWLSDCKMAVKTIQPKRLTGWEAELQQMRNAG